MDKVKNLFVGVQPNSTVDGGTLTLSDKGRAFRFIHRWPLLMQVIMHAFAYGTHTHTHTHTHFIASFATPLLLSSPHLCSCMHAFVYVTHTYTHIHTQHLLHLLLPLLL